jgi:hypothetical protein
MHQQPIPVFYTVNNEWPVSKRDDWLSRLAPAVQRRVFLVANVLRSMANHEDGACWPLQSRIALETGLTFRSVKYAIKTLVDKGWLSKVRRDDDSRCRMYLLQFPPNIIAAPVPISSCVRKSKAADIVQMPTKSRLHKGYGK